MRRPYRVHVVQDPAARENRLVTLRFARKISGASLAAIGFNFLWAQFIVWGLSSFGIHSGITGVFLILTGVTSALVPVVAIGMMQALRDVRRVLQGGPPG